MQKTTEQLHIDDIHKRKARCEDNDTALADVLERDISTSFAGGNKFIYELLQNADDAASAQVPLDVEFKVYNTEGNKYLLFSHSGEHFSSSHVNKITSYANQREEEKSIDQNKIGYKGIGFKAVFTIAKSVVIFSRGYRFRFDSEFPQWQQCTSQQAYPWQVIPIVTDANDLPASLRDVMTNPLRVNFLLKLIPGSDIESALKFVTDNSRMLLFLRNIRSLKVVLSQQEQTTFEVVRDVNGICDIRKNGELSNSWAIKAYTIKIPATIKQVLLNMGRHACPDRLKQSDTLTISFAALMKEGRLCRLKNTRLYCYLPTQVSCELPYIINADFLLDPARAHLADNEFNQFLLGEFAYKQFEWLTDLAADEKYRLQVLNVLSGSRITSVSPEFNQHFTEKYKAAASKIAFVPGKVTGTYLRLKEAVIDDTAFYRKFPHLTPQMGIKRLVEPDLERMSLLRDLGVSMITFPDLLPHISRHAASDLSVQFQSQLLQYLYSIRTKDGIEKSLEKTPFIMAHNAALCCPDQLYLPTDDDITQFPGHQALLFLHPVLLTTLAKNQKIVSWLKNLGVKKADPLQFLRGYVFDQIKTQQITTDNVVALSRFAMQVARDHPLTTPDWSILQQLPVLADNSQLHDANALYLSDLLRPALPLQQHVHEPGLFISRQYCANIAGDNAEYELQSWRQFLIKIGVNHDIVFSPSNIAIDFGNAQLPFFREYLQFLKDKGQTAKTIQSYHKILNIVFSPLMSYLRNPEFSRFFLRRLLDQWHVVNAGYQSRYQTGNVNQYHLLDVTYLQYIFQKNKCLPGMDGLLHRSINLYDPAFISLCEYDRSFIVLDPNFDLTPEQFQFFMINPTLSFKQCINFLNNFPNDVEVACYAIIWRQLLLLEAGMSTENKSQLKRIKLMPNQNNELCRREDMSCFAIPGEATPLHADHWLKHFPGFSQLDMIRIAILFGVPVVGQQTRTLDFGNDDPVIEHRTQQLFMSPVVVGSPWTLLGVAVWLESHAHAKKPQAFWDDVAAKFAGLQFYEVNRLGYNLGNKIEFVSIPVYLEGQRFYYARGWRTPARLTKFLACLADYLGFSPDTIIKLERLLLVKDRRGYLEEWRLPLQASIQQHLPATGPSFVQAVPPDDAAEDDTDDIEQPLFREVSREDTSDDEFEEDESSVIDSYEVHTPPTDIRVRRTTPETTPMGKQSKKTSSSARQATPPDQPGVTLIEPTKFFKRFLQIPAARFTVKNVGQAKAKVSLELLNEVKQPRGPAVNASSGAAPDEAGTPPTSGGTRRQPGFFQPEPARALTQHDKDKIGRCGEELIYLRQRFRYETRYPDCEIVDKANGFQVVGQDQAGRPVNITVIWHNKDVKRDEDRDLTIVKLTNNNRVKRYVEVKATTTNKCLFNWTANEIALAKRKGDRYKIFHIRSISDDPTICKIKDPVAKLEDELQIAGYTISF